MSDGSHADGVADDLELSRGWITAIDADSGTVRWKHETELPTVAGMTTTAGGLVLTGHLSGEAVALDARTGRVLWRDQTNNAIGGARPGPVKSDRRLRAAVTPPDRLGRSCG